MITCRIGIDGEFRVKVKVGKPLGDEVVDCNTHRRTKWRFTINHTCDGVTLRSMIIQIDDLVVIQHEWGWRTDTIYFLNNYLKLHYIRIIIASGKCKRSETCCRYRDRS